MKTLLVVLLASALLVSVAPAFADQAQWLNIQPNDITLPANGGGVNFTTFNLSYQINSGVAGYVAAALYTSDYSTCIEGTNVTYCPGNCNDSYIGPYQWPITLPGGSGTVTYHWVCGIVGSGVPPCDVYSNHRGSIGTYNITVHYTSQTFTVVIEPSSHDFGSLAVGAYSLPFNFTVRNTGNSTGSVTISLNNTWDFVCDAGCGTYDIGPSGTHTVTLRFHPSNTGTRTGLLVVTGGGSPTANLSGIGTSPDDLCSWINIQPSTITLPANGGAVQFPTFNLTYRINTGQAGYCAVGLYNAGYSQCIEGANVHYCSGNCNGSWNQAYPYPITLPAGSGTVTYHWVVGIINPSVPPCNVYANHRGTIAVWNITVNYEPEPFNVTIGPPSHDFGSVQIGQNSASFNFTVANITSTTGIVVINSNNPTEFPITSGGSTVTLGSHETHPVTVHFTPGNTGSRIGLLVVTGGGSPTASMTGQATGNIPVVGIDSPANGSTVSGVTTVFVTGHDYEGGRLARVEYQVDGVLQYTDPEPRLASPASTWNWDTRLFDNNNHILTVKGYDYGMSVATQMITITISNPLGSLSGVVRNQTTQAPIANANVILNPGGYSDADGTDPSGQFLIQWIPANTGYSVTVSAAGYLTRTVNGIQILGGQGTGVVVTLAPTSGQYRIESLNPDPNPAVSQIEQGGQLSRFYKIVDAATGLPCAQIPLRVYGLPTFPSDAEGIVEVKIPSSYIQDGSVGSQETFTITELNGLPIDPLEQISFLCSVLHRNYFREWENNAYVRPGLEHVRVEIGSGSSVRLADASEDGQNGDRMVLKRQSHAGAGLGWGVGAPITARVNDVGFDLGAEATGIASFTQEDEYMLPYPNLSDWQAVGAFIIFGDGNQQAFDAVLVRLLGYFEEWFASGHSITSAYVSDAGGIDLMGSVSGNLTINSLMPMSYHVAADVSGEAHAILSLAYNQPDDQWSIDNSVTCAVSGGVGSGLNLLPLGSSPASQEAARLLGVDVSDEQVCGVSCRLYYNNPERQLTGLSWGFSSRRMQNDHGVDTATTYATHDVAMAEALVSLVPTLATEDALFRIGGTMWMHNETIGQTLLGAYQRVYIAQHSMSSPRPHIKIEQTAMIRDELADLDISFGISEPSGGRVVEASISANGRFMENRGSVVKRGELVNGRHRFTEQYYGHPEIQLDYSQLLNHVLQHVPWQIRAAAYLWDWIHFFFREGEQDFPLGDGGSFITLGPTALPQGQDSIGCHSWGWYGSSQLAMAESLPASKRRVYQNLRLEAERSYGMKYGIGGFYQFEPYGLLFQDTTTLTIQYQDAEIDSFSESQLAMYMEDKPNHDWILVGGTLDTMANTVTARITTLGTYTLAPRLPRGTFSLIPSQGSIPADDSSRVIITSTLIHNNDGSPVADGLLFDISADAGTITTFDADATRSGIQVASSGGSITCELRSGRISYRSRIRANSVDGTAEGETYVLFTDNHPPSAPTSLTAVARNGSVELSWTAAPDSDVVGYRIYFDTDGPNPPYNGVATVNGQNSPIEVGKILDRTVTGLWNDTLYYFAVTAVDLSDNESAYSPVASARPVFPSITDLVINTDGTDVLLNWTPVEGANEYDIYWGEAPSANIHDYTLVGTTYQPFYRHQNATTYSKRFYCIVAR